MLWSVRSLASSNQKKGFARSGSPHFFSVFPGCCPRRFDRLSTQGGVLARLTTGAFFRDLSAAGYEPETARIAERMWRARRARVAKRPARTPSKSATAARACFPIRPPLRRPAVAGSICSRLHSRGSLRDTRQSSISGSGETSSGCGCAKGAGGSDQGARRRYGRRRRLRSRSQFETEVRFAFSDCHGDQLVDVQSPRQEPRDDHAVGSAFRASPRRHSNDRSRASILLLVHGLVDEAKKNSRVADIKTFPFDDTDLFIDARTTALQNESSRR